VRLQNQFDRSFEIESNTLIVNGLKKNKTSRFVPGTPARGRDLSYLSYCLGMPFLAGGKGQAGRSPNQFRRLLDFFATWINGKMRMLVAV